MSLLFGLAVDSGGVDGGGVDGGGGVGGDDVDPRGRWTDDEDVLVRALVTQHGASSWSTIALQVPGRSGKQCRER
jgi:hypothetical protein